VPNTNNAKIAKHLIKQLENGATNLVRLKYLLLPTQPLSRSGQHFFSNNHQWLAVVTTNKTNVPETHTLQRNARH